MRPILIFALSALTVGTFAAESEPPKLEPVPKLAVAVAKVRGHSAPAKGDREDE